MHIKAFLGAFQNSKKVFASKISSLAKNPPYITYRKFVFCTRGTIDFGTMIWAGTIQGRAQIKGVLFWFTVLVKLV